LKSKGIKGPKGGGAEGGLGAGKVPSPAYTRGAPGVADEDDLETLVREVEGVIRKADRELSLAHLQRELLELQSLLDRQGRQGLPDQDLPGALGQAMGLASRFAAGGRFREGMVTVVSVLRALLSESGDRPPLGEPRRVELGGLEPSSVPYLEAFVASLAPRLAQLSQRQLWEWVRTTGSDGIDFLDERISWRVAHPRSGVLSRDGFLCHDGAERAVGFKTFCLWLDKCSSEDPGH
jgi:hypothetical protein